MSQPSPRATRACTKTISQNGNRAELGKVNERRSKHRGTASLFGLTATRRAHINIIYKYSAETSAQARDDSPWMDDVETTHRTRGVLLVGHNAQRAESSDNSEPGPPQHDTDSSHPTRRGQEPTTQKQETALMCIIAQAKHARQPAFETAATRSTAQ